MAAVVLYNNVNGTAVGSRLDTNYAQNPAFISLALPAAVPILAKLAAGEEAIATVKIDVLNELRNSENIIAQTKWGNPNKVVFVGAHLDSVPAVT